MATPNYNLPTISGNMTADVVRDMNALATATDGAIKTAIGSIDLTKIDQVDSRLTEHLEDMAKHNQFMDGEQKKQLVFGINKTLNCLTVEEVYI